MSARKWVMPLTVALVGVTVIGMAGLKLRASEPPRSNPATEQTVENARATRATVIVPPETGAFTGVFKPPAPFSMDSYDEYVSLSGKAPAIIMWFQPWDPKGSSQLDVAAIYSVYEKSAIPMITWEPWSPGSSEDPADQPDYSLSKILSGEYDDYIRSWAVGIKEVQGPVMLRPMHEMNGWWYPWNGTVNGNTPEDFVKAWRHVHGIFEEEGATNVTWVWSINWGSLPNTPDNAYHRYYPGDDYVDWTSISGFNWGLSVREDAPWKSFDDIYAEALSYLRDIDKPIVLSEFGCVSAGGDKAGWIRDTYEQIRTDYPEIRAVVYYDHDEQRAKDFQDWSIGSVPGSAEAFAEALSDDHYQGAPSPQVVDWWDAANPTLLDRLSRMPRVY